MNIADDPHIRGMRVSELLTGTADGGDPGVHHSVAEVLQSMRDKLGLTVVFLSDASDAANLATGLGLLPPPSGTLESLATPIVLANANTYGALCCLSDTSNGHQHRRNLEAMRMSAMLVARNIDSDRPLPVAVCRRKRSRHVPTTTDTGRTT